MLRVAASFKVPWIARVPKLNKPKVALFSTDYGWLRNDDELARFLRAAHAEGEAVYVLYATAAYTGLRAGELAALEWPDVDLERRLITVQRSFLGPTKSGIPHVRLPCPGRSRVRGLPKTCSRRSAPRLGSGERWRSSRGSGRGWRRC